MIEEYSKFIIKAVEKFNLNIKDKLVLTEAATGNYVCTPVIAAVAGAEVIAFTKNSKFGSVKDVIEQTNVLAEKMNVKSRIKIITDINETAFERIDIITNTGHLRPINRKLLSKVRLDTVIPLMYEPWEFRKGEIDLDYCRNRGILVCGTNESDPRLRTMDYLGFIVLYLLLKERRTPFITRVLITGTEKFTFPIKRILESTSYKAEIKKFEELENDFSGADVLVVADHDDGRKVLSEKEPAILRNSQISNKKLVIHICGNVDFNDAAFKHYPDNPSPFGFMSFTTDYIDPIAVIDLHTAGLKVAEGMIQARTENRIGLEYKNFMEKGYPALTFPNNCIGKKLFS